MDTRLPYTTLFRSLHGIDVLSADLEHVLVPAEEPHVAVRTHQAHVAGVKPAVGVDGPCPLLGPLVVARRDDVPADEDQIGSAHVCTPVTNAHLVCRILLEKKT